MRALTRHCILSCLLASSLACIEPPSQLDPQEDMSPGDMSGEDMNPNTGNMNPNAENMSTEEMKRLEIEGGEAEIELKLNVERPITVRAFDEMGEPTNPPEPLRWMSNNTNIVQIKGETSTSGDVASQTIVGVKTGRAVIEVTSPGWKLDRISIVVTLDLETLEVDDLTLEPGQTATPTLTATNSDGKDISDSEGFDYTDFSWRLEGVSPAGCLTIDEATGALTANAAGRATLVVSEETTALEASAAVTVTPATFTTLRANPPLIIGYPEENFTVEAVATNDYGAVADFDGCTFTATTSDDALLVTADEAMKTATLTLGAGAATYNTLTLECGKRPDNSPRQVEIPVRVLSRQNLALGETFSCAMDLDSEPANTTTCWGSNARRQLLDADVLLYKTPEFVGSPYHVVAGAHIRCELDRKLQEDNVTCRGKGLSPTGKSFTMPDAIWLSAGGPRVCALDVQGRVGCVGTPWDPDSNDDPNEPRRFADQFVFQALDVGDTHGCGVDFDGVVWCWGNGRRGQLSPGRDESSLAPIGTTLPGDVPAVDVRAGDGFTCALNANHDLYCWGANERGQLGVGDDRMGFEKVQFFSDVDVLDFTLGEDFGCAITRSRNTESTQTVQCWGDNSHGELGLPPANFGKVLPSGNPVDFLNDLPLARVEAGKNHVCAITSAPDSEVYCWGSRLMGRLGDNEDGIVERPKDSKVGGARVEAGAFHNCALTMGEVSCWGRDTEEQRGDGALQPDALTGTFIVTDIINESPLTNINLLTLGLSHGCAGIAGAMGNTGMLWCWGLTAPMPPLDEPPMVLPNTFERANLISLPSGELRLFSTGRMHTCVVMRDGSADTVHCAGDNQLNQLGTTPRNTPVNGWHQLDSPQLNGFLTQIESTLDTTCALTEISGDQGGELICWGANASDLANTGTSGVLKIDSRNSGLDGFVEIQLGAEHVCARTENNHLYCWGDNSSGQVGQPTADGTSVPEPRQLVDGNDTAIVITDFAVGWYHTCYINQADSKTYCFGNNDYGQLGWETRAIVDTPYEASLGMNKTLEQISAGAYHTCGVDVSDDKIHCWGDNTFSQSESDKLGVNVNPGAVDFSKL